MKGDRDVAITDVYLEDNKVLWDPPFSMKHEWWRIVVLVIFALLCALVARGDNLAVTTSVPFFAGSDTSLGTVTLLFDWNTTNDKITNLSIGDGFPVPSISFDPADNAIYIVESIKADGDFFQIDPDLRAPTSDYEILPAPGTYTIAVYESCTSADPACFDPPDWSVFTAQATATSLRGSGPRKFALADPVATPEPATLALAGFAVLLLLAKSLRRLGF
jgi:hypothetical protein